VLAAAPRVQNQLPEGSTWDGKSDLPMDEGTFRKMLSEMEPGSGAPGAPAGAAGTPGGAARSPQPAAPKNGG